MAPKSIHVSGPKQFSDSDRPRSSAQVDAKWHICEVEIHQSRIVQMSPVHLTSMISDEPQGTCGHCSKDLESAKSLTIQIIQSP